MDQSEKDRMIRQAINDRLLKRSVSDTDFRRLLIDHPKSALARELGIDIPDGVHVTVLPETKDHVFIVIPRLDSEESGTGVAMLANSSAAYGAYGAYGVPMAGVDRLGHSNMAYGPAGPVGPASNILTGIAGIASASEGGAYT